MERNKSSQHVPRTARDERWNVFVMIIRRLLIFIINFWKPSLCCRAEKKGTKQDRFEGGRNIIFLCFDLLLSAISQVAANDEAVKKDNKHLTTASMALCTSRDFSFAATHGEIVIVCDGVLLSFFLQTLSRDKWKLCWVLSCCLLIEITLRWGLSL